MEKSKNAVSEPEFRILDGTNTQVQNKMNELRKHNTVCVLSMSAEERFVTVLIDLYPLPPDETPKSKMNKTKSKGQL